MSPSYIDGSYSLVSRPKLGQLKSHTVFLHNVARMRPGNQEGEMYTGTSKLTSFPRGKWFSQKKGTVIMGREWGKLREEFKKQSVLYGHLKFFLLWSWTNR